MFSIFKATKTDKWLQILYLEKIINKERDRLYQKRAESQIKSLLLYRNDIKLLTRFKVFIAVTKTEPNLTTTLQLDHIIKYIRERLENMQDDLIFKQILDRLINANKQINKDIFISFCKYLAILTFLRTYFLDKENFNQLKPIGILCTLSFGLYVYQLYKPEELSLNTEDIFAINQLERELTPAETYNIGPD